MFSENMFVQRHICKIPDFTKVTSKNFHIMCYFVLACNTRLDHKVCILFVTSDFPHTIFCNFCVNNFHSGWFDQQDLNYLDPCFCPGENILGSWNIGVWSLFKIIVTFHTIVSSFFVNTLYVCMHITSMWDLIFTTNTWNYSDINIWDSTFITLEFRFGIISLHLGLGFVLDLVLVLVLVWSCFWFLSWSCFWLHLGLVLV